MSAYLPHPVPARFRRIAARRRTLLIGCALGATAMLAVRAGDAQAQAFNGTPTPTFGSDVTFSRNSTPTPGSETITVNGSSAIIDWNINPPAPGDPYVFLPQGNTATFQNGPSNSNFAVLNRIFGSNNAPVRFDGTVISQLRDTAGAITGPGGTVVFQNSGGIIVGATATFDVGNLVLTALTIGDAGYGDFFTADGSLTMSGVPSPYNQAIEIEAPDVLGRTQIQANAEGSYLVLAAPRIIQRGNVRVNGNVAYAAGEGVVFRVNGGLFDIELRDGSDGNGTPIDHSGSTGGPASTGAGDRHAIYMLTAGYSSNQAVRILLAGDIGFDATSASVENGEIVLSSGLTSQFDFEEGGYGTFPSSSGSVEITGGNFTSDVTARVTDGFFAEGLNNPLSFTGDLVVVANGDVELSAIFHDVTVDGDVSLTSLGEIEFGYGGVEVDAFAANAIAAPAGLDVFGESVGIFAENGNVVTIVGNANLDASATGTFDSPTDQVAGDGTGGTVRVEVGYGGGAIDIGGNLDMRATGSGAITTYSPNSGGNGTGGFAYITAADGDISVAGTTAVDVSGTGSRANGSTIPPGTGQGGSVFVTAERGSVTLTGSGTFTADGTGGELEGTEVQGRGGIGRGGTVEIRASADGGEIRTGAVTIENSGWGGDGVTGGSANGGRTVVRVELGYGGIGSTGVLELDSLAIETSGFGGEGSEFTGGVGGAGTGGTIEISARGGALAVDGVTNASANGLGGGGVQGGGRGTGGDVLVEASQGSIDFGGLTTLGALGFGGDGLSPGAAGGVGESGYGEDVSIYARNGGTISAAALDLSTQGSGGRGGAGSASVAGGAGGAALGGGIVFNADPGGSLDVTGRLEAKSSGNGGTGGTSGGIGGGNGGAGTGGSVRVNAFGSSGGPAAGQIALGEANLDASSSGGAGANGGNGLGGTVQTGTSSGGQMTVAGRINVDSIGRGGEGLQGTGGEGRGGLADLFVRGGALSFGEAVVRSDGFGGNGVVGGNGFSGFSANTLVSVETGAFITAQDGTITGGSGSVSARGTGGNGSAGPGGNGTSDTAEIAALNGDTASGIDLGSASLDISATGGSGGPTYNGGNATVGRPNVATGLVIAQSLNGTLAIDTLTIRANATGGDGGAPSGSLAGRGGDAVSGYVQFGGVSGAGTGTPTGTVDFGTVDAQATARGGAGGGNGGNATGGTLVMSSGGAAVTSGAVNIDVSAFGGNAGAGAGATGGNGTGGRGVILLQPRNATTDFADAAIGPVTIVANGTGGNASFRGTGGAGTGGLAQVSALGPGATGNVSFGDLNLTANGEGGEGGTGGNGSGGEIPIAAQGIAVTFGNATITANGTGGRGLPTPAVPGTPGTPEIPGTSGLGSGGVLEILSLDADGTLTGNSLDGLAGGFGDSAQNNSAGRWLVSVSGGNIAIGTVALDADVSGFSVFGQTSQINVNGGSFDVGTSGAFYAVGQTELNAEGTGQVTGGNLSFRGTFLTVTHDGRAAGDATVDAESFTAQVGADFFGGTDTLIRASDQITIAPDGIAVIGGTIVAPEIFVRSSDIDVTGSGFIGGPGTTLVELTVIPGFGETFADQVILGGTEDGYGGGYTLSNAEAGRIRTDTLSLVSALTGTDANRDADLLVRELTLSATPTANGGAVNRLEISFTAGEGVPATGQPLGSGGQGIVQVEEALSLANAGTTSGVFIDAGRRIQIINPSGSIRVLASGGAPAGALTLRADDIWSASETIIDQLLTSPTFAGRNAALLAAPATVQERGFIEGGEVTLAIADTLLVQNTGPAGAFGGITVGSSLTIEANGTDVDVYAFGRQVGANGSVTNSAFFREVEFGYGTSYAAAAEFNQCIIATGVCPDDPIVEPEPEIEVPIGSEIIEGPIEETEESVPPPNPDRQEFVDVSFASESLLEEPVTSGGDSSVWDEECEGGTQDQRCDLTDGGN